MDELDEHVRHLVLRAAGQDLVELVVEALLLEQILGALLLLDDRLELVQVLLVHQGDGPAGDVVGDAGPDLHHVLQIGTGELGHGGAPVGMDGHQPLGLQLTQGLPHGDMAHGQGRADLILLELGTALELTADDALAQHPKHPLLGGSGTGPDRFRQFTIIHSSTLSFRVAHSIWIYYIECEVNSQSLYAECCTKNAACLRGI